MNITNLCKITQLNSDNTDNTTYLFRSKIIKIGSDILCDIYLENALKVHVQIETDLFGRTEIFNKDVNPIFLNDIMLYKKRPIFDNSIIQIGNAKFRWNSSNNTDKISSNSSLSRRAPYSVGPAIKKRARRIKKPKISRMTIHNLIDKPGNNNCVKDEDDDDGDDAAAAAAGGYESSNQPTDETDIPEYQLNSEDDSDDGSNSDDNEFTNITINKLNVTDPEKAQNLSANRNDDKYSDDDFKMANLNFIENNKKSQNDICDDKENLPSISQKTALNLSSIVTTSYSPKMHSTSMANIRNRTPKLLPSSHKPCTPLSTRANIIKTTTTPSSDYGTPMSNVSDRTVTDCDAINESTPIKTLNVSNVHFIDLITPDRYFTALKKPTTIATGLLRSAMKKSVHKTPKPILKTPSKNDSVSTSMSTKSSTVSKRSVINLVTPITCRSPAKSITPLNQTPATIPFVSNLNNKSTDAKRKINMETTLLHNVSQLSKSISKTNRNNTIAFQRLSLQRKSVITTTFICPDGGSLRKLSSNTNNLNNETISDANVNNLNFKLDSNISGIEKLNQTVSLASFSVSDDTTEDIKLSENDVLNETVTTTDVGTGSKPDNDDDDDIINEAHEEKDISRNEKLSQTVSLASYTVREDSKLFGNEALNETATTTYIDTGNKCDNDEDDGIITKADEEKDIELSNCIDMAQNINGTIDLNNTTFEVEDSSIGIETNGNFTLIDTLSPLFIKSTNPIDVSLKSEISPIKTTTSESDILIVTSPKPMPRKSLLNNLTGNPLPSPRKSLTNKSSGRFDDTNKSFNATGDVLDEKCEDQKQVSIFNLSDNHIAEIAKEEKPAYTLNVTDDCSGDNRENENQISTVEVAGLLSTSLRHLSSLSNNVIAKFDNQSLMISSDDIADEILNESVNTTNIKNDKNNAIQSIEDQSVIEIDDLSVGNSIISVDNNETLNESSVENDNLNTIVTVTEKRQPNRRFSETGASLQAKQHKSVNLSLTLPLTEKRDLNEKSTHNMNVLSKKDVGSITECFQIDDIEISNELLENLSNTIDEISQLDQLDIDNNLCTENSNTQFDNSQSSNNLINQSESPDQMVNTTNIITSDSDDELETVNNTNIDNEVENIASSPSDIHSPVKLPSEPIELDNIIGDQRKTYNVNESLTEISKLSKHNLRYTKKSINLIEFNTPAKSYTNTIEIYNSKQNNSLKSSHVLDTTTQEIVTSSDTTKEDTLKEISHPMQNVDESAELLQMGTPKKITTRRNSIRLANSARDSVYECNMCDKQQTPKKNIRHTIGSPIVKALTDRKSRRTSLISSADENTDDYLTGRKLSVGRGSLANIIEAAEIQEEEIPPTKQSVNKVDTIIEEETDDITSVAVTDDENMNLASVTKPIKQQCINQPHTDDLTDVIGVKELFNKSKKDDLTDVKGIKELMNRPMRDDLTNVQGVKQLMKTPKVDDLTDVRGVKELMNTPTVNDLTDVRGVKELMNTPIVNDLRDVRGVKELMNTPAVDDLTDVRGVKELMNTPMVNDLMDVRGVKELMNTPMVDNLIDVGGVKRLMKTPYQDNLLEVSGIEQLMKTQLINVTVNDNKSILKEKTNLVGIKHLLKTPVKYNSSNNLSGIEELLKTPLPLIREDEPVDEIVNTAKEDDVKYSTSDINRKDDDNNELELSAEDKFDMMVGHQQIKHTYERKSKSSAKKSTSLTETTNESQNVAGSRKRRLFSHDIYDGTINEDSYNPTVNHSKSHELSIPSPFYGYKQMPAKRTSKRLRSKLFEKTDFVTSTPNVQQNQKTTLIVNKREKLPIKLITTLMEPGKMCQTTNLISPLQTVDSEVTQKINEESMEYQCKENNPITDKQPENKLHIYDINVKITTKQHDEVSTVKRNSNTVSESEKPLLRRTRAALPSITENIPDVRPKRTTMKDKTAEVNKCVKNELTDANVESVQNESKDVQRITAEVVTTPESAKPDEIPSDIKNSLNINNNIIYDKLKVNIEEISKISAANDTENLIPKRGGHRTRAADKRINIDNDEFVAVDVQPKRRARNTRTTVVPIKSNADSADQNEFILPKRVQLDELNDANLIVVQQPECGGRKRKFSAAQIESDDTNKNETDTYLSLETQSNKSMDENIIVAEQPKRRGRKPRVAKKIDGKTPLNTSVDDIIVEEQPKRGGRKATVAIKENKSKIQTENQSMDSLPVHSPLKRRGRKPRAPVENNKARTNTETQQENNIHTSDVNQHSLSGQTQAENQPKRRVRPTTRAAVKSTSKTTNEENNSATVENNLSVQQTLSHSINDENIISEQNPKRGRRTTRITTLSTSNIDEFSSVSKSNTPVDEIIEVVRPIKRIRKVTTVLEKQNVPIADTATVQDRPKRGGRKIPTSNKCVPVDVSQNESSTQEANIINVKRGNRGERKVAFMDISLTDNARKADTNETNKSRKLVTDRSNEKIVTDAKIKLELPKRTINENRQENILKNKRLKRNTYDEESYEQEHTGKDDSIGLSSVDNGEHKQTSRATRSILRSASRKLSVDEKNSEVQITFKKRVLRRRSKSLCDVDEYVAGPKTRSRFVPN